MWFIHSAQASIWYSDLEQEVNYKLGGSMFPPSVKTEYFYVSEFVQQCVQRRAKIYHRTRAGNCSLPEDAFLLLLEEATELKSVYTSVMGQNKNHLLAGYEGILDVQFSRKGKKTEAEVQFQTTSKAKYDAVLKICKEYLIRVQGATVYVIATSGNGLTLSALGTVEDSLVRSNYSSEVLEGFDYIIAEYNKPVPAGRISILNGCPGSGKSHLIKAMIPLLQNTIPILVPSKLIGQLDGPNLTSLLTEYKYILSDNNDVSKSLTFILEDADQVLAPRNDGNVSEISSLLNYADGIFGSMLDIRIVATTNVASMDFDDALVRPGRLCKHIFVDLLDKKHAAEIYKRETGETTKYDKPTSLAQVYADAKGADTSGVTHKPVDKKVGFGT